VGEYEFASCVRHCVLVPAPWPTQPTRLLCADDRGRLHCLQADLSRVTEQKQQLQPPPQQSLFQQTNLGQNVPPPPGAPAFRFGQSPRSNQGFSFGTQNAPQPDFAFGGQSVRSQNLFGQSEPMQQEVQSD